MKKLLSIIVLGLLLGGNAYAEQYIEQTIDYSECAYKLEKGKILYSDYNNYNEHNNENYNRKNYDMNNREYDDYGYN